MKEKFLRILSPITLTIVALLDIAVIAYGFFAIKKIIEYPRASVIFFAACDVLALIIAVLVTKEVLSYGVKFYDDELEFVGLDNDNIFAYENIVNVDIEKDTKASFVKNFVDRKSKILLTLKDEKVISIDIGLTTKHTLEKIADEINSRISATENE